jgi:hypothetical protein
MHITCILTCRYMQYYLCMYYLDPSIHTTTHIQHPTSMSITCSLLVAGTWHITLCALISYMYPYLMQCRFHVRRLAGRRHIRLRAASSAAVWVL